MTIVRHYTGNPFFRRQLAVLRVQVRSEDYAGSAAALAVHWLTLERVASQSRLVPTR
jgi:alpha-glucuronidase